MLKQRIITAVVALVLLFVVLFALPQTLARVVIAGLIVAAAWEWSGMLILSGIPKRAAYAAAIAVLQGVTWWFVPDVISYEWVLYLALGWWLSALVWMFFYPTDISRPVVAICGALILVPAYLALDFVFVKSPALLLFLLAIVWAADVGAYFSGKKFGRVKLAPSISPGKTWEGVVGGLLAVSVLAMASSYWGLESVAVLLPFCLAIGLLSVVGDLTVSMFKRHAGIKDSGSLFPGHGGLLDRIDSVAAASTLFAAGIAVTGLGSGLG